MGLKVPTEWSVCMGDNTFFFKNGDLARKFFELAKECGDWDTFVADNNLTYGEDFVMWAGNDTIPSKN